MIGPDQAKILLAELAELLPDILGVRLPLLESTQAEGEEDAVLTKVDPVFTGGCVVSLLLSDTAAPPPSHTKDVDAVMAIGNYQEFAIIESKLRKAGFEQDMFEKAGVVAWRWKGIRVDILPSEPNDIMQTVNRWFPALLRDAQRVEVTTGKFAWIASAPCFVATKLEAFVNRGRGDFLLSKDIEDIIAVLDGREEIVEEVKTAEPELRQFVSLSFRRLMVESEFEDAVVGSVKEVGREIVVFKRMEEIAADEH